MIKKHEVTLKRRLEFLSEQLKRAHLPGRSFTASEHAALSELIAESTRLDTFQPELREVLTRRDEQDSQGEFGGFNLGEFLDEIQELANCAPRCVSGDFEEQGKTMARDVLITIAATAIAAAKHVRSSTNEPDGNKLKPETVRISGGMF